MVCAVISIVINLVFAAPGERSIAWIEGFAILAAVFICSTVAATNDYQKANKFRELYEIEQSKKEIELIRYGKKLSLSPEQLVVGDLVLIKAGMEVHGDGIVVESFAVEVDESSMTGESEPRRKDILTRCIIEVERLGNRKVTEEVVHQVSSAVLISGTKVAQR